MHVVPVTHPVDPRWWQWPTVLSIDAVAIVVLWHLLLARATGAEVTWPGVAVLGASVWLAYVCDRWLEGWRLSDGNIRTPRHRFHRRHRWPLVLVWIAVLLADVAVAVTFLTPRDIAAGLALTSAAMAYVFSHQWLHRDARGRAPKEFLTAVLLATGTALFVAPPIDSWRLVVCASLFGVLCFTNCALISRWERDVDVAHEQTSLAGLSQWAARAISWLPWICIGAAVGTAVVMRGGDRLVPACAIASAAMLAVVDRTEPWIGWAPARVLSDLALCTPVVPLLLS